MPSRTAGSDAPVTIGIRSISESGHGFPAPLLPARINPETPGVCAIAPAADSIRSARISRQWARYPAKARSALCSPRTSSISSSQRQTPGPLDRGFAIRVLTDNLSDADFAASDHGRALAGTVHDHRVGAARLQHGQADRNAALHDAGLGHFADEIVGLEHGGKLGAVPSRDTDRGAGLGADQDRRDIDRAGLPIDCADAGDTASNPGERE